MRTALRLILPCLLALLLSSCDHTITRVPEGWAKTELREWVHDEGAMQVTLTRISGQPQDSTVTIGMTVHNLGPDAVAPRYATLLCNGLKYAGTHQEGLVWMPAPPGLRMSYSFDFAFHLPLEEVLIGTTQLEVGMVRASGDYRLLVNYKDIPQPDEEYSDY